MSDDIKIANKNNQPAYKKLLGALGWVGVITALILFVFWVFS